LYYEYNTTTEEHMGAMFGTCFARLRREKLGVSLRQFCRDHGFDPGNISKLERGKLPPPQSREKLEQYASALGLAEGSDEWYEFFDTAFAERGELPEDLASDEALVGQLPVLFRTLRGDAVAREELEELLNKLRRA
jgi:transcriptional regulator with XRE-family HTH domain